MQRNILDAPFEDELQLDNGESVLWKGSQERDKELKSPKKKNAFDIIFLDTMKDEAAVLIFLIVFVPIIGLFFYAAVVYAKTLIMIIIFFIILNLIWKLAAYLAKSLINPTRYFITQKRIIIQKFGLWSSQFFYFDRNDISSINSIQQGELGTIFFK